MLDASNPLGVLGFLYGGRAISSLANTLKGAIMDSERIKEGVRLILEGIGEDSTREALLDTPDRVARMCEEIFGGLHQTAEVHLSRQFPIEENELVLERDIPFYSMCEHHLLPFFGKVHIAYMPNGKVAGLSKLARAVDTYAAKPQIQEKLTMEIADGIMTYLNASGVMVIVEAEHLCLSMRGVKKPGTVTATSVTRGVFKEDATLKDDVYRLIALGDRR